jgi:hypothetical protein
MSKKSKIDEEIINLYAEKHYHASVISKMTGKSIEYIENIIAKANNDYLLQITKDLQENDLLGDINIIEVEDQPTDQ